MLCIPKQQTTSVGNLVFSLIESVSPRLKKSQMNESQKEISKNVRNEFKCRC